MLEFRRWSDDAQDQDLHGCDNRKARYLDSNGRAGEMKNAMIFLVGAIGFFLAIPLIVIAYLQYMVWITTLFVK